MTGPASSTHAEVTAGVVLLRRDGAALLQHRDDKPGLSQAGMWVPPGGHSEPGESVEACAKREFLEETDYECETLNWLASHDRLREEGMPDSQITFFWAFYDGVQPYRCLEGQDLQFVERHLADSYPGPPYVTEVWDLAIAAYRKETDHS